MLHSGPHKKNANQGIGHISIYVKPFALTPSYMSGQPPNSLHNKHPHPANNQTPCNSMIFISVLVLL